MTKFKVVLLHKDFPCFHVPSDPHSISVLVIDPKNGPTGFFPCVDLFLKAGSRWPVQPGKNWARKWANLQVQNGCHKPEQFANAANTQLRK